MNLVLKDLSKSRIMNDNIVKENIGSIYKLASKFYGAPKEDLIQAGYLGLEKAKENYKDGLGAKFSTYAYTYIFGEMYAVVDKYRAFKINKDTLRLYKEIEKVRYNEAQKLGYIPSNFEVANIMNLDVSVIDFTVASAYETLSIHLDNDDEKSIEETVFKEENISIDDRLNLEMGLDFLDREERLILEERYFKDETQANVARKLKKTQVMISRMEKKALNKMREYIVS